MASGFCTSLLLDINDVAGSNAPNKKLHIAGFLSMLFCCQDSLSSVIAQGTEGGHRRSVVVKYRPRPLVSSVQTADDCDIDTVPAYSEWNVPALTHKQITFFIADDTVRQYCKDASLMREVPGTARTRVMDEVYGLVLEHANTLMKAINQDLVARQATEFGVNVSTNDDGGSIININNSPGTSFNLSNGIIQIMRDIQENEICGTPCIVGGGLFAAYDKAQALLCCNQAGLNMGNAGLPRFFFDKDTQSIWGSNSIGLFAPGSVKFIPFDKYVGEAWSGQKGTSFFTNIGFPINEFECNMDDCLRDLRIDMQLRYLDCPQNVTINGVSTPVGRGWVVTLSKDYLLWTQPDTGFASGDSLFGTNGTIKYFISNTSYTGGAYSLY